MIYAATKEQAHELIERIDPAQVAIVVDLLEKLLDPLEYALKNAPFEDEEISEEERLAVAKAKAETGPGTSMEDFLTELGLTYDDLKNAELAPLDTPAEQR
jgi:hypothetical protein